jgi:hypothetical protein
MGPARNLSVVLLLAFLILNPRKDVLKGIFSAQDKSPQEFAEYINANVDKDATIESWEWEIDFLTNRTYHHPPTSLISTEAKRLYLGDPYDPDAYDFRQYNPDYVAVGKFAKWTGLYSPDFLNRECTIIKSVGEYDLYKVNTSKSY